MSYLTRFLDGDIRALSRIVSFIENRQDGYRELLGELYQKSGNAVRIGITGPPGAGKSTLINAVTDEFLKAGKKIGIVAVDPTSPFTGGALLGDRVRMNDYPLESGIYFRSMASRGASGGLAAATANVSVALDAFGFDYILIETVGVGQVELDIVDTCDTVVVAVVPESGDSVQAMKAGLMEIADVFVVNKADRPGADRLASEFRMALDMRTSHRDEWDPPVLTTVAVKRERIDLLANEIENHLEFLKTSGLLEQHRRDQIGKRIIRSLENRFQREFLDDITVSDEFSTFVDAVYNGSADPFKIADDLYARFGDGA